MVHDELISTDGMDVTSGSLASLRNEVDELRRELASRAAEVAARDALIASRDEAIAALEKQIEKLIEQISEASKDRSLLEARLKELLRRRRRLSEDVKGQGAFDFGDETPASEPPPHVNEAPDGETPGDSIPPKGKAKRKLRKLNFDALPREEVEHVLPEQERVCSTTGLPLVQVDEKVTEELDYRPGKLVVIVHRRAVYGLSEEHREERQVEPVVAPAPRRPIENALASASLLAWVLVQKYRHHLPLYRQQAIFAREGLEIPRQTLCDWVMASMDLLRPIQDAMRWRVVKSGLAQCDDTPVICQGPKGAGKFQARLWTYLSPSLSGVVFDFTPDRGHEHVKAWLTGFEGFLVGDGYAGYAKVSAALGKIVECGCWAHVLRKFRDAEREWPGEASRMVALIGELFAVEREAAEAKLEAAGIVALRERKSRPVLDRIRVAGEELEGRDSEQGGLAKAVGYMLNQWPKLVRFLEDGRVPIHNNSCELAIRPVAVGRRNWLFAGSERGGHAAATAYTLIESCRRVGLDPFEYLRDVLQRILTHPPDRVEELIPANWKALHAAQGAG